MNAAKHLLAIIGVAVVSAAIIIPMFTAIDHFEGQRQSAMQNVRTAIITTEWVKVCDRAEAATADYYDLGGNMAGHNN